MSCALLFLPLLLAACADRPVSLPPPAVAEEVQPAIAAANLQGLWTITSINGRHVAGLWLELGSEGPSTITQTDRGIFVGSPQPRTQAYLGCNWWRLNGWTRDGNKLTLQTEMSLMTERGCGEETDDLEKEAHTILRETMTMEFDPPNRLRLANAVGSVQLLRAVTEQSATAFVEQTARPGMRLSDAINTLVHWGFACRRLARHEYGPTGPDGQGPDTIRVSCHVAADRTAEGYRLVYASLTASSQEQLVSAKSGSYPVLHRNLRVDDQGRIVVVQDPTH